MNEIMEQLEIEINKAEPSSVKYDLFKLLGALQGKEKGRRAILKYKMGAGVFVGAAAFIATGGHSAWTFFDYCFVAVGIITTIQALDVFWDYLKARRKEKKKQ